MNAKNILDEKVLEDNKNNKKQSYVKMSISPTGVVSFSTTTSKRDSTNSRSFLKVFK